MCTYENWPKSVKCAMCGTIGTNSNRSQASSILISSPEHSNINQDELYIDCESNNHDSERKVRRLKRNADWNWLNACIGVIEGDPNPVEAYLSTGGDPARTLTASEVAILNRNSAFDVGHTLVHLAIRLGANF